MFYKTTDVKQHAAQHKRNKLALQVLHQREPTEAWTEGSQLVVPVDQVAHLILPEDITEERKCWESTNYGDPVCAGTHAYIATLHTSPGIMEWHTWPRCKT